MNETTTPFPQTRQDLSNLKSTAVDAAKDIGSTAAVHADKVKGNLKSIAESAQIETGEHIDQAKSALNDLGKAAGDYVASRPLASIGIALAVGFLFAKITSSRSS
jgi:ElaB/YqjD/DUF883 family membrane-anchored ribosome-binding protein